MYIDAPYILNT